MDILNKTYKVTSQISYGNNSEIKWAYMVLTYEELEVLKNAQKLTKNHSLYKKLYWLDTTGSIINFKISNYLTNTEQYQVKLGEVYVVIIAYIDKENIVLKDSYYIIYPEKEYYYIKSDYKSNELRQGWIYFRYGKSPDNYTLSPLYVNVKLEKVKVHGKFTGFRVLLRDKYFDNNLYWMSTENINLFLSNKPLPKSSEGKAKLIVNINNSKPSKMTNYDGDDFYSFTGVLSYTNINNKLINIKVNLDSYYDDNIHINESNIINGTYNIEYPDHIHNLAAKYNEELNYIWFPIEYNNENRYIHSGLVSNGCVSVSQQGVWQDLCIYLLSFMNDNDIYLGTIEFIYKGE